MFTKEKGHRSTVSGSNNKRPTKTTVLPPQKYMNRNNKIAPQLPNLINIHKHQYKSKHFQFGTTLPTEIYHQELEKTTEHCKNMIKELRMREEDLTWVGDKMHFQDIWPIQRTNFRIAQLNVNGMSFVKDNFKIDCFLQGIMALQIDVATIQEINLNLAHAATREKFQVAMKRFDQRAGLQMAKQYKSNNNNIYNPGGTAVWHNGMYAGRVTRKGQDTYGRWSYMVFLGKKQQEIIIISAYNTCCNAPEDGNTIAGQLVRAMYKERSQKQHNIRKAFFKDIQEFIIHEKRKGTEIILAMDANTPATSNDLKELRLNTGMVDVFTTKHPTTQHPKTYYRGQNCLDYIYASPFLAKGIIRAGYAPFYELGQYDHRLLYVDFNWNHIFNYKADVTQPRGKQLSIKNRRITKIYLKTLTKLEEKAGVYNGIKKIRDLMANAEQSKEEKEYCINKLKTYKTVMLQLMASANRTATKSKPKTFQWSKKLRLNGKRMRYWNDRKRSSENGDSEGLMCKIPQGYKPKLVHSHDDVMNEYFDAKIEWIKTKDTSALLHHQYMVDLIEHIGETRGCSKETAKKLLYHQEASKAGHEKQSKYIKKNKKGLVTELLVPTPHSNDTNAHTRLTDEKTIETILLRRNRTKLTEAIISPFCKGTLADLIDENGRCDMSKKIIEGRFDMKLIDNMNDVKHKSILKKLIRGLARKRDTAGRMIADVDTKITMKNFQDMFQKKNELTSCGPRGIIMPHWKIMTESNRLSTIQAWLMEAPFAHGFTYKEWEVSVHCMLKKDALPFYHRLRIIQLFEGDMNGALQLLFGKRQMQYMDENNLNTEETYGGRKGKGCHQALNRIQYTALYSRTMRQPLGLIDVDATGCFDRMVGRLLSLINQCNGMTQNSASCQAEVLHNMQHYVKTTRGISEKFIKRTKNSLLEGNGQGNAASVPGWHGHNELMCSVYKQLIQGSRIISPDRRIDFEQWLSSFIDDNKMLLSFTNNDTYDDIINTCQKSLQYWEILLNLTGGAVELTKCCITILRYQESYKWYEKQPGVPRLIPLTEQQKQCVITREGERGTVIKQQDVAIGARLLGVKAAANGTFAQEYKARLEKSQELAGRLITAPLSIAMSWQVYYCRWKPAITYCLPITTFTERECKNIQSPFYNALLPKLGINRHMPRTLLHGPLKLAGLSLTNLSAEQLAMHITGLVTQLRKRDRVGLTMHASIDALQLYLGTTAHFFTLNANTMEHRPSRRESPLVYIWEELNSIQCSLICEKFWTPTKTGTNDVAIIDAIQLIKNRRKGTTNHLPKTTIWYVNACRLYLQVTMLSEITTPCGNYLEEWAFHGTRRNPNAFLKYPHQDKPPTHVWRVWRDSIRAAFLKQSTTNRPTLHLPLQRNDYVGGIISWREGICEGMTLEAAIELLPQYIRESLGTIKYPVDNGQRLSKAIKTSVSTSYTDGTVKAKIGAHAYTIRTENDREDVCLSGVVGTPGDANTMTSLRAEHFGVFASIILLDIITMIHGHTDAGEHTHYTDSQAVIDRLNSTYYFNDRQYDSTDYDIWKETENAIKKAANITFTLKHVKGHQKEDLYEVRKQQGPLSRAATYNDWCDSAAETERLAHQKPIQKHFMPAATIYLKTPITLVTASAYRVIYDRKTIPAAQEYVITKLSLTKDTYDMINWEAMGSYMKALAVAQRVKVMKFIYDWQNVGSQKEQQQWADPEEFMCPYKCGQREIPMHYIICAQSCNKMSRMCLEAINQWMIKVRTNNRIRLHIMEELYAPLPMKRIGLNIEYKSPDLFEQARNEQTQLGWKLLFKGLISKTWGAIQEDEYIKIRQREGLAIWYTGSWWTKSLIKHIVFWSLNEWQKRNEQLHKDIEQRECEKTRKENKEHIVQLYQLQETNPVGKLRRYYKVPLIEKLQQNPTRQRQWIETIRALRDKASIQRSKNRL